MPKKDLESAMDREKNKRMGIGENGNRKNLIEHDKKKETHLLWSFDEETGGLHRKVNNTGYNNYFGSKGKGKTEDGMDR